jgi:hypothetical protein
MVFYRTGNEPSLEEVFAELCAHWLLGPLRSIIAEAEDDSRAQP